MSKLTTKEINQAFGGFDPGIPQKTFLAKRLAGLVAGYGIGEPQGAILQALDVMDEHRNITKRGRLFLADWLIRK
jgi:hypothetical protein